MNVDGSNRRQLTADGKNKFLPHFSPDGTRVLYTKFLVGGYGQPNSQTDVAVYDFGSGTETLLTHTGNAFQPIWSPDGKRVAFGGNSALNVMNADGSNVKEIGAATGADDDKVWGDPLWSSDDWIVFVVGQLTSGGTCFKTRLDKMRPDGSARTKLDEGGPNCTPNGREQSGDADPGISADGKTIYSSRGFPGLPAGLSTSNTMNVVRRLYSLSSDAWTPGKVENDLSLPADPNCIEGVPKGSPDGTRILVFRICFDGSAASQGGTYVTDTAGSFRTFVGTGFGADWNPVAPR